MNDRFDPAVYWEARHQEFRDDPRNVGSRGFSPADNFDMIVTKASIVSHTLGKHGIGLGANVLDAGCGAGLFTWFLASTGFRMTGIDVSETAIASANARGVGDFVVGPISQRVVQDEFDAVLCLDVLFHIVDDQEWVRSLETLSSYVNKNGLLVIIEYFPSQGAKAAVHCRWRTQAQYETELNKHGYTLSDSFGCQYPRMQGTKTVMIFKRASLFKRAMNLFRAS